jgi:hypothetical protein
VIRKLVGQKLFDAGLYLSMVGLDSMTDSVQENMNGVRYKLGAFVYSVGCTLTGIGDDLLDV